jgi:methionyl aminopeptidase
MIIKTEEELKAVEEIGQICGRVLKKLVDYTEVGMTTKEIDKEAGRLLEEYGAESAPSSEYDFPGFTLHQYKRGSGTRYSGATRIK